ncbi:hypothetical protein [Luteipulveratus mongoliensis]|nr:hypothetical protein [Luteipulveratus mongoliensis]
MTKKAYSDADRIMLFRSAFHDMAGRSFWPDIREHGRVDRLATVSFRVVKATGMVEVTQSAITDRDADLLASHIRKFTSSQDPAYVLGVLRSAVRLGATGTGLREAESQWEQISAKRFPFLVADGASVGMRIPGLAQTIWWPGVGARPLAGLGSEDVSPLDCADVYFNEGLFHTFEQDRREDVRAVVRSIPPALRDNLARMALGVTIYCVTILHHVTTELSDDRTCGDECPEMQILKRLSPQGLSTSADEA